jgi:molybdopterin/thiamine biosynthesis adenylyltransferase
MARLHGGEPILIAGVGNLGHRAAAGLAPLKVPLWLVDHGLFETENVGLQLFTVRDLGHNKAGAAQRHLLDIDPLLPVRAFAGDIRAFDLRELRGCRLVIGCLDNLSDRLWLMQTTMHFGIPYLDVALDGSGQSLYGRVSGLAGNHETACLACGWDDSNWQEVADETPAACRALWNKPATVAPTLALPGLSDMVAGLAGVQATRLLLGFETDRVLGREVRLNLTTGDLAETRLRRDPQCRLDHRRWAIDPVERSASQTTLCDLFEYATSELGGDVRLSVYGDHLLLEAACPTCRRRLVACRLGSALPDCGECGTPLVELSTHQRDWFDEQDVAADLGRAWAELGLKAGRAVLARGRNGDRAYLLSA